MNKVLARHGWKKEKVLSPKPGSVVVRYRLGTIGKVARLQARTSLARVSKALEVREDIESVFFTELTGRLDYMGRAFWRVTLMVELAGMKQDNFFHLLSVE